ncbi:MAG: hypothetical protein Q7T33_14780 [Dehalococcoidia bacterium]|nr:hypothetical protein [Dehalococcoidia bacterium]
MNVHPLLPVAFISMATAVFFLLTGQPLGLSLASGATAAALLTLGLLGSR